MQPTTEKEYVELPIAYHVLTDMLSTLHGVKRLIHVVFQSPMEKTIANSKYEVQ
jgi:hypothetical protein